MDTSKLYSKRVSKVFKQNFDKEYSDFESEFLPIFVELCDFLNEDTATEVFGRLVTYSNREPKEALYNLINLFELFEENYDIDNDPFTDDEWDYIKMIVNDSSDDLGIDLVKYIMQVMLDLDLI